MTAHRSHPDELPVTQVFEDLARRMIVRCDAVIRVPGASSEADSIVELARWEGKPILSSADDIHSMKTGRR